MKKNIILFPLFIFIVSISTLQSCCNKSTEVGRYELSDIEKSFIPYEKGQSITFLYSENSQSFSCNVMSLDIFETKTFSEHCNEDYYVYEFEVAELISNNPQLYLSLQVMPIDYNPNMSITVNNTHFNFDITKAPDIDTVYIQGIPFTDVYKIKSEANDDNVIVPNQVLFNKTYGVLQIKLTNDETYDIKL